MRFKRGLTLFGLLVITAACAGPPEPVTTPLEPPTSPPAMATVATAQTTTAPPATGSMPEPSPALEPTATTAAAPATAVTEPAMAVAPESAEDRFGVDAEGYFVRGLASAPVIIEDYSDFL